MSGSTPYFQFGAQRRYPYAWHGGPGGVPNPVISAEARELGNADLIESGLSPYALPSPAFARTSLHATGDWPLARPAGPELLDPLGALSSNEAMLAKVAGAAAIAFVLFRKGGLLRKGRRR